MSKTSSDFESEIGKKYTTGKVIVTVEDVIAEGGFGVVFRAKNASGQRFALKRLYVNEEPKLLSCRREIQIMNSLSSHKNIVTFVDSSITRDYKGVWEVLILMQYYPGTCMKLLNENVSQGLKEPVILKIFCDICEAVSRLHHCQTPIMHRDLKVENILIESPDSYVLCDFGSATARCYVPGKDDRSISEIEEDIRKSPEMINLYGDKSITTKSDIWALGVTLYRLSFRALPFGESTLAIQGANLNIPHDTSPYSKGLHALISYCLEPDPDLRPDIYQVSHVAFILANKKCPVKNIHNSPTPDVNRLIDTMMRRTSKSMLASTPKVNDRGSERIERTTVTPRERPKAGRGGTTPSTASNSSQIGGRAVQRQLIPDNGSTQRLQQMKINQQQQYAGTDAPQINQNDVYLLQQRQQQALYEQQLLQQQLAQRAAYEQQQLAQQQAMYEQQQQQAIYEQQQQSAIYEQQQQQQLAQQQALYEQQQLAQQQAMYEQQQAIYEQQQQQAIYEQQQKNAIYEQQQQQQLVQQQALYEQQQLAQQQAYYEQQQLAQQQAIYEQQQQQAMYEQRQQQALYENQQKSLYQQQQVEQQHLAQLQRQMFTPQPEDKVSQEVTKLSAGTKASNGSNGFDDDFSQTIMFEADFSQANFESNFDNNQNVEPPVVIVSSATPQAKSTVKNSSSPSPAANGDSVFKVPPVPAVPQHKPKTESAGSTRPKSGHRRNVSDTSVISIGKGVSAFRVYAPNKNTKQLTASLGSLNSLSNMETVQALARSKSEATSLSDTISSTAMKSSSLEGLQNWNPFADDADSISDDVIFGKEFDRLRCGSQSSIQNVKSREDLVMLEDGSPTADPFSAAPFYYKSKGRHVKKEQKISDKYSRLGAASEENLLQNIDSKSHNQKIFGVPIPFKRKVDRNDKYHKVPTTDSDNESLGNKGHHDDSSGADDDDDEANQTFVSHYNSLHHDQSGSSSNSGTLTRENGTTAMFLMNDQRPNSCNSNFSSTITPPPSSSENLTDPFGAAPFSNKLVNPVIVDSIPIKLLPNNPFLTDIMSQSLTSSQSHERLNHTAAATANSLVQTSNQPKSATSHIDFSTSQAKQEVFLPKDEQRFMSRPLGGQGFLTLPRVPKSKTVDSINISTELSGSGDQQDRDDRNRKQSELTLKRSQTDFEISSASQSLSIPKPDDFGDNLSDSENLLGDASKSGSLTRKKDKGRKSPKFNKAKSPRFLDNKKSLVFGGDGTSDGDDCEGALTNEAFSDRDAVSTANKSRKDVPPVAPKPAAVYPHPPVAPKPSKDRRPPVAVKPKTYKEAQPPLTSAENSTAADEKTPDIAQTSKDFYKTHKRYSSYDIATGRGELSLCKDSDSSKSALVEKEGNKSKKKNKMMLNIF